MSKKILFVIKTNNVFDLLIHIGLVTVFTTLVFVLFFNAYLPATTHHDETVTVPDLVGMNVAEVEKFLASRDLNYEIRDSSYSRIHKPYVVLTQSPESGAKVKQSRKLFITINPKNPPKVKAPKLTDVPFTSALRTLRNMDLELGKIKYKPFIGQNVVLEQLLNGKLLEPGTPLPKGTKIDLVIGDGLGEKEFPVPNLVGMPLDEAEFVIKGHDLFIGTITYDYKSSREIGTVLRQSPTTHIGKLRKGVKSGSMMDDRERYKVRAGDIIDLWVAGNPAARPQKEDEDEETQRKEDSLNTNINIRREDEIKRLQDKYKPKKPNEGKDKKPNKDKENKDSQ